VLNPERIILGGPVLQLGETYTGPLREALAACSLPTARESVEVVVSTLTDAALLGAAALVLE
jgi:hypothetical protein